MAPIDLRGITDIELLEQLRNLRLRIALLEPHIDTARDRTRRTTKIVRGTILTAGGFLAATIDPLGLLLVVLGGWDWVDTISDDADTTNRGLAVRRQINALEAELDEIESELVRRGLIS